MKNLPEIFFNSNSNKNMSLLRLTNSGFTCHIEEYTNFSRNSAQIEKNSHHRQHIKNKKGSIEKILKLQITK